MSKIYDIPAGDYSVLNDLPYDIVRKSGNAHFLRQEDLDTLDKDKPLIKQSEPSGDRINVELTSSYLIENLLSEDMIAYLNLHDTGVEEQPIKIQKMANWEAKNKHFHNINYKTEMYSSLYPKREFVFGELQKIDWYSDTALTDLVLTVEVTYNRNPLGFAVDRETHRKWVMENGEYHPDVKITKKDYTINPQDQLDEIIKKRTNNVRQIILALIGLVSATEPGMDEADVIASGRDFFDKHDHERNLYVNDGSESLEEAVRSETEFSWLDNDIIALTGLPSIRSYIIYNLSSGVNLS